MRRRGLGCAAVLVGAAYEVSLLDDARGAGGRSPGRR